LILRDGYRRGLVPVFECENDSIREREADLRVAINDSIRDPFSLYFEKALDDGRL
jgi:hypothetical protein